VIREAAILESAECLQRNKLVRISGGELASRKAFALYERVGLK